MSDGNIPIGGLLPVSFLDWDGRVVSVIFTQGCNFHCPYCHNRELVLGEVDLLSQEWVIEEIKCRKDFLDGIVISGGEPTVHEGLPCFIRELKKATGLPVKLDTNGSNPDMLKTLIHEKLISCVAMDMKGPWDKYQHITRSNVSVELVKASLNVLRRSNLEYVLRTTYVPHLMSLEDLKEVQKQLSHDRSWRIQLFSSRKTLDEEYLYHAEPSPLDVKEFLPDVPVVGIDL
jgi:pyruvate formate lyase activating enzyme